MPPKMIRGAEQERLWAKAKALAEKQGHANDWPYIVGIFKRMRGFEKSNEMKKSIAHYIPGPFRQVRLEGQVPSPERLEAMRLARARPKALDVAELLRDTNPRISGASLVDGLGFNATQFNEYQNFLEKAVASSGNEVVLRKEVMSKLIQDGLDPVIRNMLLQRSLNHWRLAQKSLVEVVSVDDLSKAVTPIGGVTPGGYRKISKDTYVKVGSKEDRPWKKEVKKKDKPKVDAEELFKRLSKKEPGQGGKVGLTEEELKVVLKDGRFALVSAGPNPRVSEDRNMTEADIAARSKKLEERLVAEGYQFSDAEGHYEGKEPSYLVMVHDADRETMLKIGEDFKQDSIVFADKGKNYLHYTYGDNKGKYSYGEGFQLSPEASDFFTKLNSSGTKFQLNINVDKLEDFRKSRFLDMTEQRFFIKGGPYIGPRGGKYKDPEHKIPWTEEGKKEKKTSFQEMDRDKLDALPVGTVLIAKKLKDGQKQVAKKTREEMGRSKWDVTYGDDHHIKKFIAGDYRGLEEGAGNPYLLNVVGKDWAVVEKSLEKARGATPIGGTTPGGYKRVAKDKYVKVGEGRKAKRGQVEKEKSLDPTFDKVKNLSFGDIIIFHGEKGAAKGSGADVKRKFYFVEFDKDTGFVYLSKNKPKIQAPPLDEPMVNATHSYRPEYRMGLGAILPFPRSSKRPDAMTLGFIDGADVEKVKKSLSKAEPRGGTYYKRTPTGQPGKYRYFYSEEEYDKARSAHVSGDKAGKAYLSGKVLKCVQKAGKAGCEVSQFEPLVKQFGSKKVAAILKENKEGGKLTYKGKKFYYAEEMTPEEKQAEKKNPKLFIKEKK